MLYFLQIEVRREVSFSEIERKNLQHANRGEDSSIYCWSIQSMRYDFQSSGHVFQGRFLGMIFEFVFLGMDFEVHTVSLYGTVRTAALKSRQKTE